MVLLAGGEPVAVETRMADGFKMKPEALEKAITPKTKWIIFNSPSNPTGAAYTRDELQGGDRRAVAASARLGDDRRHVRAPRLRRLRVHDAGAGRAEALRAHADHERHVQGLLHDRLAHRLCRRAGAADQGDGDDPVAVDLEPDRDRRNGPRSRRSTARRTSSRSTTRSSRSGATSWSRCSTRRTASSARSRKARSTSIRRARGTIGKTASTGKKLETDEDFVTELLEAEGVAVVQGTPFGVGPAFRISYATQTEELEEACRRIQRFCGNLK